MRTLEHIYMDINAWTDIGTESHANYSESQAALENLESTLNSLDDLLSEFGSICRPPQEEHLQNLSGALEAMKHCRQELSDDIEEYIDRPLQRCFNELNDIFASIDEHRISVPNELGLDAERYYFDDLGNQYSSREKLKEITLADIMGNHEGTFGITYDQKIEQFTNVLERDYDYYVLKRNADPEMDKSRDYTYNDYISEFYTISETIYVKDMTTMEKVRNAIWRATGVGYIVDSVRGYSLINGDILTAGERNERLSEGVGTVALTLLPGVVTYGSGAGLREALLTSAKCFEFNAIWNAAPDAAEEIGLRDLGYVVRLCMLVYTMYEMGKIEDVEGKVPCVEEKIECNEETIVGESEKISSYSGEEWYRYYCEKYGADNVVKSGSNAIDYVKLSDELGNKIEIDGYKIIDIEDAATANADWADMGYDLPPVAAGTKVYNVEAGNYQYARVFKEGVNKPKSPFILRADDIEGLSASEIAEKYALPQVPDKIVYPQIPCDTPLEVSIVGPQELWGTLGGDAQYAIKDVLLDDDWFTDIHDLK